MNDVELEIHERGTVADASVAYACEQAVIRFTAAFDHGDQAELERHFAPNCVWHRADGDIIGRDQLRQRMRVRPSNLFVRHVLSNLRTQLLSSGNALVESYVTVYRHEFNGAPTFPAPLETPDLVGRYRDELTPVAGQWQLVARSITVDFKHQHKGRAQ